MKSYKYEEKTEEEYEIDKIVSKKIMENLQNFFKIHNSGTAKNR